MTRVIFLVLILCTIISCNNSTSRLDIINSSLAEEKISSDSVLVLYIAEGMCSECIIKEFDNLKTITSQSNDIMIVGMFSNYRLFKSNVSRIDVQLKFIEYPITNTDELIDLVPHYFVYHPSSNKMSSFYIPQDCDDSRTIDYLNRFLK